MAENVLRTSRDLDSHLGRTYDRLPATWQRDKEMPGLKLVSAEIKSPSNLALISRKPRACRLNLTQGSSIENSQVPVRRHVNFLEPRQTVLLT